MPSSISDYTIVFNERMISYAYRASEIATIAHGRDIEHNGVAIGTQRHDAIVLARSAFHHSMNYRSVVVLGTAHEVKDAAAKLAAMRALVDHLMPGRWNDVRQPSAGEIAGTLILELPITEASAKVRTGGPIELEEDYALPVWAGVVPLTLTPGAPHRDERLPPEIELPDYVQRWRSGAAR